MSLISLSHADEKPGSTRGSKNGPTVGIAPIRSAPDSCSRADAVKLTKSSISLIILRARSTVSIPTGVKTTRVANGMAGSPSFFPITDCGITRWPTVGYALFCVFQREGKTHRRGFITRIRVPGDDHEKSSYRPRLFALVCCPWVCARYWHHSHSPSLLSKL